MNRPRTGHQSPNIVGTCLSLQYRRALLGTVICFSHMALQWNQFTFGTQTIREGACRGIEFAGKVKTSGGVPYQKFRKLAAMSGSLSSALLDLAPDPSLEMHRLTPLRCNTGRVDLGLGAKEADGERR